MVVAVHHCEQRTSMLHRAELARSRLRQRTKGSVNEWEFGSDNTVVIASGCRFSLLKPIIDRALKLPKAETNTSRVPCRLNGIDLRVVFVREEKAGRKTVFTKG